MNTLYNYTGNALLPEILSIGWGEFRQAALGGPRPDGQDHVYEICYIEKGTAEWWIGNDVHDIGPGNAFINQPGEWHGGKNAMLNPCEVYWVQVYFSESDALPGLTHSQTQELRQRLASPAQRFFPVSISVRAHFIRLIQEYCHPQQYSDIVGRSTLHILICELLRDLDQYVPEMLTPEIQAALDWIDSHITEDLRLETVAGVAGMSKGHFSARFAEVTGFSPHDFCIRQRVRLAKSRLRDPKIPITEIAHELGFSSSQYFATVFKKLVGTTPGEYRQMALSLNR